MRYVTLGGIYYEYNRNVIIFISGFRIWNLYEPNIRNKEFRKTSE